MFYFFTYFYLEIRLVILIINSQNSQTLLVKSSNKFLPFVTKGDIIKLSGQISFFIKITLQGKYVIFKNR